MRWVPIAFYLTGNTIVFGAVYLMYKYGLLLSNDTIKQIILNTGNM